MSGFLVPECGPVTSTATTSRALRPQQRARGSASAARSRTPGSFGDLTVHQTLCVALDDELEVWDPIAGRAAASRTCAEPSAGVGSRADELIEKRGSATSATSSCRELSTGTRRLVDLACQSACDPR